MIESLWDNQVHYRYNCKYYCLGVAIMSQNTNLNEIYVHVLSVFGSPFVKLKGDNASR